MQAAVTQPVTADGDHDMLCDEENEKVLTTLETIPASNPDDEEPFATYEVDDLPSNEEQPIGGKNDLTEMEIARLQLESLATQKVGRPKKSQVTIIDEKGNISNSKVCSLPDDSSTKDETVTLVNSDSAVEVMEVEEEVITIPVEEESVSTTNDGDSTLERRLSNLTES